MGRSSPRSNTAVLGVPQVGLAVDASQPARVNDGRAVVDRVARGLGEAADDCEPNASARFAHSAMAARPGFGHEDVRRRSAKT